MAHKKTKTTSSVPAPPRPPEAPAKPTAADPHTETTHPPPPPNVPASASPRSYAPAAQTRRPCPSAAASTARRRRRRRPAPPPRPPPSSRRRRLCGAAAAAPAAAAAAHRRHRAAAGGARGHHRTSRRRRRAAACRRRGCPSAAGGGRRGGRRPWSAATGGGGRWGGWGSRCRRKKESGRWRGVKLWWERLGARWNEGGWRSAVAGARGPGDGGRGRRSPSLAACKVKVQLEAAGGCADHARQRWQTEMGDDKICFDHGWPPRGESPRRSATRRPVSAWSKGARAADVALARTLPRCVHAVDEPGLYRVVALDALVERSFSCLSCGCWAGDSGTAVAPIFWRVLDSARRGACRDVGHPLRQTSAGRRRAWNGPEPCRPSGYVRPARRVALAALQALISVFLFCPPLPLPLARSPCRRPQGRQRRHDLGVGELGEAECHAERAKWRRHADDPR